MSPNPTGNQPSLRDRLASEGVRLRNRAQALGPGPEQDEMIRKARLMQTASHINEWLTSPGLRPPR